MKGKYNILMRVNTDGKRNENELSEEQLKEVIEYAVSLGMSQDKIYYIDYDFTAYGKAFDLLRIGTDVLPADVKLSKNPNDNISLKGAIAHEIVGHREAALKNITQENDLLEEVQASIRAARFTPDLNYHERIILIKDALTRLKNNKIKLRDVRDKLHINER